VAFSGIGVRDVWGSTMFTGAAVWLIGF